MTQQVQVVQVELNKELMTLVAMAVTVEQTQEIMEDQAAVVPEDIPVTVAQVQVLQQVHQLQPVRQEPEAAEAAAEKAVSQKPAAAVVEVSVLKALEPTAQAVVDNHKMQTVVQEELEVLAELTVAQDKELTAEQVAHTEADTVVLNQTVQVTDQEQVQ